MNAIKLSIPLDSLKSLKWAGLLLLLATAAAGTAWADGGYGRGHGGYRHGGAHFGFFIGAPLVPWYYPAPYSPYYYAPPVIVERAPPVYVEQTPPAPAPLSPSNDWYYCNGSQTYYPYITECPGGWQRVTPHAAPPR